MTTVYAARGHGLQPSGTVDPGATGRDASGKLWTEQAAADIAVPAMVRRLRTAGVDTFDEGRDDPNFVGTITAANRKGADLVVSLHCDWTGGLEAHTIHYPGSTGGEALATAIADRWVEAGIPVADRTVHARDNLSLLKRTAMPAVIVEMGRIASATIDTPAELERMGELVADGILDHLGVDRPGDVDPPAGSSAQGWAFPEHAERLLDRGIYSEWTAAGANVDTDNLSAYLDRARHLWELRDNRLRDRIASLEAEVAKLRTELAELAAAPATTVDVEIPDAAEVAAEVAKLLELSVRLE